MQCSCTYTNGDKSVSFHQPARAGMLFKTCMQEVTGKYIVLHHWVWLLAEHFYHDLPWKAYRASLPVIIILEYRQKRPAAQGKIM